MTKKNADGKKPQKETKNKLTDDEKKDIFKRAKKVKSLKGVDNPVKGQLFKTTVKPKKGEKRVTVFMATGENGFNKFRIVANKKKTLRDLFG